jgi:hypothetical protein
MVSLPTTPSAYHSHVTRFHEWFSLTQRESREEQLDHVEGLEADMRRIADAIKENYNNNT